MQEVGTIENDKLITVKGIEYTIAALMPKVDPEPFRNGKYGIFFLSPSDCHRVFAPQAGSIEEIIHVPGYRLLVHPPYQCKEYPAFSLNERIIIRMTTPLGKCILVLVAGWGVGHVTLRIDAQFAAASKWITHKLYGPPINVKHGEWIATFELGSTVILITEATKTAEMLIAKGETVRYGQPVFRSHSRSEET